MRVLWKTTVTIAMLSILLCLDSCSGIGQNNVNSVDKPVSAIGAGNTGKVQLKYAQWAVPLTSVEEAAILKYNNENKDNIQVELLKIPRDNYNDTLNILLSSGEGPDVFEARGEWLYTYNTKNWLFDLTNQVDNAFFNQFPEDILNLAKGFKFRRHFYSIPSGQTTYRLIYNKDLFRLAGLNPERPPRTFDELSSYAKKISNVGKGARKYGFAIAANDFWNGFIYPMEAVNSYSGVYFFDYGKGVYDLSVYEPWFKTVMKMKGDGSMFPGETAMKENLAMIQFAEGNIGMMFAENCDPALFENLYSTKCDWAVAIPPAIDNSSENRGKVGMGIIGWQVVYNYTKHPDQAVLFWKYLYSQGYNVELYQSGSFLPLVGNILNDPRIKPDIQKFADFLPGKSDARYSMTPLDKDEYTRGNVYLSIWDGSSPLSRGLSDESYKMNSVLERYENSGFINIKDFIER